MAFEFGNDDEYISIQEYARSLEQELEDMKTDLKDVRGNMEKSQREKIEILTENYRLRRDCRFKDALIKSQDEIHRTMLEESTITIENILRSIIPLLVNRFITDPSMFTDDPKLIAQKILSEFITPKKLSFLDKARLKHQE
jgi:hypothetical protein